ncbi:TRAP transporter small permease [Rhodococcus artemisiae]|uniref:TRAP transporter small permease n=1 Tax=Rhodococcus artemisiae TaxID=714159 RepID=A0ABU7L603_9NOCA|nr:TRAP transporter small permease [Rhodococcus artemisiae]MEE2056980.1 TRAP transporter small permease [Rhodococcus artemisiae]
MSASPSASSKRTNPLLLLIEVPAVIVLFIMMIHVTANALLRAFASSPIPNTLEITQYIYLPIIALLGFMAAQARGEHIVADLVTHYFPKWARRGVLAGGYILGVVVMFGFAWYGLEEALHARDIGKTAGVSTVVAWPVYFLVPLAFGVLTVQLALAAVRALRGAEDDTDPIDDELSRINEEVEAEESATAGHISTPSASTTATPDSEKK